MKTEWCQTVDPSVRKKRALILLTDVPAHPLEKAVQEKPEYYPEGMPRSYTELLGWWWGRCSWRQNCVGKNNAICMLMYVSGGNELWEDIAMDWPRCLVECIAPDRGGKDISDDNLLDMLFHLISFLSS